ncbi:MAG: N-formylglutamate amidohydrolase [Alphaproteobacteria bacterium]|nr:N-formylglutamate amidohydrolase [Alphaproteobacteria bacterium]TAD90824.1 MAG: N-formylglutamate amidohydrolase [Alphaproteobacteria bacterium]
MEPYQLLYPQDALIPLVVDSPHSGEWYPDDFGFACRKDQLAQSCDTLVHDLFMGTIVMGGTLLYANFPRCYIDTNRAVDDIDPEMLAEPWPTPLKPGQKSGFGMGLIRKMALPDVPVYGRKLSVAEVKRRIDYYYMPYHEALKAELDQCHQEAGVVLHINAHSMKSVGNEMGTDPGQKRPDFCISDYRGTTSASSLTEFAADQLRRFGYDVRINDPYLGAEIIRRYGRPADGRHSIQIEINRALYMNEEYRTPIGRYTEVKQHITYMLMGIRDLLTG